MKKIICLLLLMSTLLSLYIPSASHASSKTMSCTITYYCPCKRCCGKWAGGPTESGIMPKAGRTVAHESLPFGTKLKIDGQVYVVEDRGVRCNYIDIYCDTHSEAVKLGRRRKVPVEILPEDYVEPADVPSRAEP